MKCKNDPKRTYKGTEPSPKGNGWCAHAEKVGKKRKGTDGHMWTVIQTKTSKRWSRVSRKPLKRKASTFSRTKQPNKKSKNDFVKIPGMLPLPIDMSNIVTYQKKTKGLFSKFETIHTIHGVQFEPNKLHKSVDLNCFEEKATGIPLGFKRIKNPTKEWITSYVYDPSRRPLQKTDVVVQDIQKKYKQWKYYFIHSNGGRPLIVYIKGKCADIYALPTKPNQPYILNSVWQSNMVDNKWQYVIHVKSFRNVVKAWIGQSPKTPMTEFSGGYGPKFLGNSILLTLPKNNNIYIGGELVSKFKTQTPITEYWSPVGNNDVPYPVAFTAKSAFFMLDGDKVDLNKFTRTLTLKDKQNLYTAFYGNDEENLLPDAQDVAKRFNETILYRTDS